MKNVYFSITDNEGNPIIRLNIYYLIIALVILSFLPVFYYSYKLFVKKPIPQIKYYIFPLYANGITDSLVKKINVGDCQIVDDDTVAKIVSIDTVISAFNNIPSLDGNTYTEKDTNRYRIYLRLKVKAKVIREILLFNGEYYYSKMDLNINTNKKVFFNTSKYELSLIFGIKPKPKPKPIFFKKVTLPIIANGLSSKIIKKIKKGDYEIDSLQFINQKGELDTAVKVIAKISRIKNINNSYFYKKIIGEKDSILVVNKGLKDIYFDLDILGWNYDSLSSTVKFKNYNINIQDLRSMLGKEFMFKTNKYTVKVRVIPFNNKRLKYLNIKLIIPFQYEFLTNIYKNNLQFDKNVKYNLIKNNKLIKEGMLKIPLIRIISVDSVKTLKVKEFWKNYELSNQNMKRIWLTLQILCEEEDGIYYWKNQQIAIGQDLTLNINNIMIKNALIIDIKENNKKYNILDYIGK